MRRFWGLTPLEIAQASAPFAPLLLALGYELVVGSVPGLELGSIEISDRIAPSTLLDADLSTSTDFEDSALVAADAAQWVEQDSSAALDGSAFYSQSSRAQSAQRPDSVLR